MKGLIKIVMLGSALSLSAGAALAKPTEMSCHTTSCDFKEEMGPSANKSFHGHCDGSGNNKPNSSNSSMSCNDADSVKCSPASWNKYQGEFYWECGCTNWSDKSRGYPTFHLTCPPPS